VTLGADVPFVTYTCFWSPSGGMLVYSHLKNATVIVNPYPASNQTQPIIHEFFNANDQQWSHEHHYNHVENIRILNQQPEKHNFDAIHYNLTNPTGSTYQAIWLNCIRNLYANDVKAGLRFTIQGADQFRAYCHNCLFENLYFDGFETLIDWSGNADNVNHGVGQSVFKVAGKAKSYTTGGIIRCNTSGNHFDDYFIENWPNPDDTEIYFTGRANGNYIRAKKISGWVIDEASTNIINPLPGTYNYSIGELEDFTSGSWMFFNNSGATVDITPHKVQVDNLAIGNTANECYLRKDFGSPIIGDFRVRCKVTMNTASSGNFAGITMFARYPEVTTQQKANSYTDGFLLMDWVNGTTIYSCIRHYIGAYYSKCPVGYWSIGVPRWIEWSRIADHYYFTIYSDPYYQNVLYTGGNWLKPTDLMRYLVIAYGNGLSSDTSTDFIIEDMQIIA
jgi:hypothetical protein